MYATSRQTGELGRRESDGTGADDEDRLSGLNPGSADGMCADTEGFHQSELLQFKLFRSMQLDRWHVDDLAHAPVRMDTQDTEGLTTVVAA